MTISTFFVAGVTRPGAEHRGGASPGISAYRLDEETGASTLLSVSGGIDNPTFVALSPDRTLLVAATEMPAWPEGTVSLYRVGANGALTYVNMQPTRGNCTCHVGFDPTGKYVAVANYSAMPHSPPGNAVAVYRADAQGLSAPFGEAVHAGTGPNAGRQEQSHGHCVRWTPDGKFLCVVDLGIDRVVIYRIDGDKLVRHGEAVLPPGSGPRHIVFHPTLPFAYVCTELSGEVATLKFDAKAGTLELVAIEGIVPKEQGPNQPSGIAVTPDGRYLVAANRQLNTLGRFAIDQTTGITKLIGTTPSLGTPRDIAFTPSGRVLAVSNQDTGEVVFFRHEAGELTRLAALAAGTPQVVAFL